MEGSGDRALLPSTRCLAQREPRPACIPGSPVAAYRKLSTNVHYTARSSLQKAQYRSALHRS
eukprot:3018444-Rhodomonas_salina.2